MWWDYSREFGVSCEGERFPRIGEEGCLEEVMRRVGIDKGAIDTCMVQR